MTLWHCRSCTAAYAVGLAKCPQCGAADPSRQPVILVAEHGPEIAQLPPAAAPTRPAGRRRKDTTGGSGDEGGPGASVETVGSGDG